MFAAFHVATLGAWAPPANGSLQPRRGEGFTPLETSIFPSFEVTESTLYRMRVDWEARIKDGPSRGTAKAVVSCDLSVSPLIAATDTTDGTIEVCFESLSVELLDNDGTRARRVSFDSSKPARKLPPPIAVKPGQKLSPELFLPDGRRIEDAAEETLRAMVGVRVRYRVSKKGSVSGVTGDACFQPPLVGLRAFPSLSAPLPVIFALASTNSEKGFTGTVNTMKQWRCESRLGSQDPAAKVGVTHGIAMAAPDWFKFHSWPPAEIDKVGVGPNFRRWQDLCLWDTKKRQLISAILKDAPLSSPELKRIENPPTTACEVTLERIGTRPRDPQQPIDPPAPR